jgi:manganese oxidase
MKITRRKAVAVPGLALAGAALASRSAIAQAAHEAYSTPLETPAQSLAQVGRSGTSQWLDIAKGTRHPARTIAPGELVPPAEPGRDYSPIITPNGVSLPFRIVDGVKIFHLVIEDVIHEFAPSLKAKAWGFNGRVHGPTIEAAEGDYIRIYVTNKLSRATAIHWHGVIVPNGMDGVGGLNQKTIGPGETFKYEYPLIQYGTHMYHAHFDDVTEMALGVMGLFIIHPRRSAEPSPDRDFAILLSEWDMRPGTYRPDPGVVGGFNTLTFNAKVFPATEPLVARCGDRVRIRIANLSALDHHAIYLHGHSFCVTQTDGGVVLPTARRPETTILVGVGQSRTIDFIADNPGDWAFHCDMTQHTVNQMGYGGPNMVGVDNDRLRRAVRPLIPSFKPMGIGDLDEIGGTQTETGNTANGPLCTDSKNNRAKQMVMPENSISMLGCNGPYGTIDMGGMFTILKVRENLTSYADPGWYKPPPGTLAQAANKQDLERDGIHLHRT